MSMNGEHLRVTADELARSAKDPGWALRLAGDVQGAEEKSDLPAAEARHLSTYKAWHAIAFLLERAGFPVNIVYGEQPLADDEDWGYGPPRYLTIEQVQSAAEALAANSFDELTVGVTSEALAQADVYPQIWDEPDSMEWVRDWYAPLVPYFTEAARRGEAMLVWLD